MARDWEPREFLDALAAGTATPGGGGAAAVMGAMGAALVAMVSRLALRRPGDDTAAASLHALLDASETLRARLQGLVNEDAEAFGRVLQAYRMPRTTDDERQQRVAAIQAGLLAATLSPLACAREAAAGVRLAGRAVELGHVDAISDVGVGALACLTALRAAALNVRINTRQIHDAAFVERVQSEVDALVQECAPIAEAVHQRVLSRMG